MAAEQLSGDDADLQALQRQAVMESWVELDMAGHGIRPKDVPPGTFQRIAAIMLSRMRPSAHNYHAGGRGVSRPDYQRGEAIEPSNPED